MSLKNAAQYLAAHGRGADTTLMHVAPDEVARLQRAAQERGGSLTINPHTGLPEADFFSDLNPLNPNSAISKSGLGPMLEAAALAYFGVPDVGFGADAAGLNSAAIIGGGNALATGSLQKGLMAGLSAYGTQGLYEGAMGGVNNASAFEAAKAANAAGNDVIASGMPPPTVPMSMADTLKAGAKGIGSLGPKDLLKYGLAAAGPLAAAQSNKKLDAPASSGEGYIRQYYYDPKTHSVKPLEPVAAKDWGNRTFESRVPYLPEETAANGGLQAAYANGGVARFDGGGSADGGYKNYTADDINQYIAQNHLDQAGIEAAEKQFNVDPAAVLAAQQSGVNRWYEENPNATPQEAADAVKSIGGLNSGLTTALSQHYGLTPEEIRANYEQLTAPSSTTKSSGSDNQDRNKLINAGIGAAASHFIPGFDYVNAGSKFLGGDLPGAATSLISGLTGGLSSLFADGGAVKRFDEGGATGYSASDINNYIAQNNLDAAGIAAAQQQFGVSDAQLAAARGGSGGGGGYTTPQQAVPPPPSAPAYTNYSTDQMASYFANPANANVSVNDAIKQFNADPNAVNQYITGLTSGYVDPTNTQRGSGYLNQYQNLIKEGMTPAEFAAAASGVNKDWGKTGYWNQDTTSHAYDVAGKILAFDPQTDKVTPSDKQWVNFMDTNKISVDDISRATGLTKAEVQARYDAAKEKAVVVVPPTVITPGGVSTTGGGRTTDTYTGGTTTTPKTYAPTGTENPYGNYINPGDITINPDKSRTVTPNIPGRPYGGFTGIGQVRDAYTAGGGNLGQVLTPSRAYQNTGASADIYKYLSGQGAYPIQDTSTNSRYYYGAPSTSDSSRRMWINPKTRAYELNPNYVDPAKAAAVVNTVSNSGGGGSGGSGGDDNNTNMNYGANGGLMAAMARGGSTHQPFFSKSTGKFNYTGPKIYADGGISVGSRYDPRIDGNPQANPDVPFQTTVGNFAAGGNTGYNLGGYSDGGRLLRGPGDGVSDSIPATIGHKQPARLADGEFVVPARIVSELGNGSTEAGARKLYAMMERVQQARGKTVGKGKVAKNSRADKYLPV
jgi:hypothetical protein